MRGEPRGGPAWRRGGRGECQKIPFSKDRKTGPQNGSKLAPQRKSKIAKPAQVEEKHGPDESPEMDALGVDEEEAPAQRFRFQRNDFQYLAAVHVSCTSILLVATACKEFIINNKFVFANDVVVYVSGTSTLDMFLWLAIRGRRTCKLQPRARN